MTNYSQYSNDVIKVVVLGSTKRCDIITCDVKENKAILIEEKGEKAEVSIEFKTEQVGLVWTRSFPHIRSSWESAILWREGSDKALDWGNKDDELPPLTLKENADFIKRKVAESLAKPHNLFSTKALVIIGLLIFVSIIVGILNLAGVHIGGNTIHTVIQNVTVTPTPMILGP